MGALRQTVGISSRHCGLLPAGISSDKIQVLRAVYEHLPSEPGRASAFVRGGPAGGGTVRDVVLYDSDMFGWGAGRRQLRATTAPREGAGRGVRPTLRHGRRDPRQRDKHGPSGARDIVNGALSASATLDAERTPTGEGHRGAQDLVRTSDGTRDLRVDQRAGSRGRSTAATHIGRFSMPIPEDRERSNMIARPPARGWASMIHDGGGRLLLIPTSPRGFMRSGSDPPIR